MNGDFFDTNVLLYLASADAAKADRAEELVATGGTISVQVLNEVANVGRRKMALSWDEVRRFLAPLRACLDVVPVTLDIHETGLALAARHSLSLYDAMIAAAALHSGCKRLWSEDMQHGFAVDKRVRIQNPFR